MVEGKRRSVWFTANGKVFEVDCEIVKFTYGQTTYHGWIGDENGVTKEEMEQKIRSAQEKKRRGQASLPNEIDASTFSDESFYGVIIPALLAKDK